GAEPLEGRRILYVRAEGARNVVPASLRARGAEVIEVVGYRTVPDEKGAAELLHRVDREGVDVITFTSSSAVETFATRIGVDRRGPIVATIGPITSATARAVGLCVEIEAEPFTTEG